MEIVDLLWRPLWAPASQVSLKTLKSADSEQFKIGLRGLKNAVFILKCPMLSDNKQQLKSLISKFKLFNFPCIF